MPVRVWWVQLLTKVKFLCRYLLAHKEDLPSTLVGPANTFYSALTTFCDVLIAYDNSNPRGKGT